MIAAIIICWSAAACAAVAGFVWSNRKRKKESFEKFMDTLYQ
jgi:hypothetical protein